MRLRMDDAWRVISGVMAPAWLITHRTLLSSGGVVALLLLLPLLLSPYALFVLGEALIFAIACLGLNLVLGYTGLVSLGHAAYFGVGAYAGGFLYAFAPIQSLEVFLASGVLAAAALAVVFGLPCVRATRIHFAILTLAFAQIVHALFISGIIFRPFGGVGRGLFLLGGGGLYIPRLTIIGIEFTPGAFHTVFYSLIVVAFGVCVILMWRIVNSPFGKALQAIRDNETRALCIGIRVGRYRWCAFILSGIFTGLAGGLYGQLDRQVTPEQLHWLFSTKLVLATVFGGSRYFLGPVAGACAFVAIQDAAVRFTRYRGLVFGLLLVAVVLACPAGLLGGATVLINTSRSLGTFLRWK